MNSHMAAYLITYNLNDKTKDYNPLFVAIQNDVGSEWWHYIEDTWIVKSHLTATQIAQKLYPHILRTDYLLVIEVAGNSLDGWLPKEAYDWLRKNARVIY